MRLILLLSASRFLRFNAEAFMITEEYLSRNGSLGDNARHPIALTVWSCVGNAAPQKETSQQILLAEQPEVIAFQVQKDLFKEGSEDWFAESISNSSACCGSKHSYASDFSSTYQRTLKNQETSELGTVAMSSVLLHRQTDRRRTDGPTDRQIDKQTDRQRYMDRRTSRCIEDR